jgi:pimeloyl-ACP methyl ester carboxylesterase/DNA-binding CsgD family transcriptional regulator
MRMAEQDLLDLGASLRQAMESGRPAAAIIEAWRTLNDEDPQWQTLLAEVTAEAARINPSIGAAASIHPDAVGTAIVDARGRLLRASARFLEWVGEPGASADCRRLIAEAVRGPPAIGLVTADDGHVVSVFAGRGALTADWDAFAGEHQGRSDIAGSVLLVAFAPSKSSALAARAAASLGLTPLEARLAEALLDAPNLAIAAAAIGISSETANYALGRAMRKAGVTRASELVGRIVDLTCEAGYEAVADLLLLRRAMGLSPAEARVAAAIAAGGAAREIAPGLGLSEQTVKSYRRAIFLKTGVNRSRDLRRLLSEIVELDRLASVSELLSSPSRPQERLRVIAENGRHIALIDYGPASGKPLIVGHGFTAGRLMPPPLLARCHAAGYRVIIPQRPGFGLTDAAAGDYLETASDDLAAILDALGVETARILGRDAGTAAVLSFAARYPGRLDRPVLLNPRTPKGARPPPSAPMSAISRFLMERPGLVEPFAEMLRRQTRSDAVESMLRRACTVELDRDIIEDPAVLAQLVRDMQGMMARSVRGFVAEQRVYSQGWSPPGLTDPTAWTVAHFGELVPDPDLRPWAGLPGLRSVMIEGAGLMAAYSHPDEILALLA